MSPDQTDDGLSPISAKVPSKHAEALYQLAKFRDSRSDPVSMSDLIRDYIREGLHEDVANDPEVPGEVRDLLDDDLLADGGGDEL